MFDLPRSVQPASASHRTQIGAELFSFPITSCSWPILFPLDEFPTFIKSYSLCLPLLNSIILCLPHLSIGPLCIALHTGIQPDAGGWRLEARGWPVGLDAGENACIPQSMNAGHTNEDTFGFGASAGFNFSSIESFPKGSTPANALFAKNPIPEVLLYSLGFSAILSLPTAAKPCYFFFFFHIKSNFLHYFLVLLTSKVYFSGILAKKNITAADGSPFKVRSWLRWYVELIGPSLVFWSLTDPKLASIQDSIQDLLSSKYQPDSKQYISAVENLKSLVKKPNFINISDSCCNIIGKIGNRPSIWSLNSSGSNYFLFQAANDFEMNSWVLAIRLSCLDFIIVNELYTSTLINNNYNFPTSITDSKFKVQVKIAGSDKWFNSLLDVSRSSISVTPDVKLWLDSTNESPSNFSKILGRITNIQHIFSVIQLPGTNSLFISRMFGDFNIDYSLLPSFQYPDPSSKPFTDSINIKFNSQSDCLSSILSISYLFSLYGVPSKFVPKYLPNTDNVSFPLEKIQNLQIETMDQVSSRAFLFDIAINTEVSSQKIQNHSSVSISKPQTITRNQRSSTLPPNSQIPTSSDNSSAFQSIPRSQASIVTPENNKTLSDKESKNKSKKFSFLSGLKFGKKKTANPQPNSTQTSSNLSSSSSLQIAPPTPQPLSNNNNPNLMSTSHLNNFKPHSRVITQSQNLAPKPREKSVDFIDHVTEKVSKFNLNDSYIDRNYLESSGEVTHVESPRSSNGYSKPNSTNNSSSNNFSIQLSDSESDEPISSLIDSMPNNRRSRIPTKIDTLSNSKNTFSQRTTNPSSLSPPPDSPLTNENFIITPKLAAAAAQVSLNDFNSQNNSQFHNRQSQFIENNNFNTIQKNQFPSSFSIPYQDQPSIVNNISSDIDSPGTPYLRNNINPVQDNLAYQQPIYYDTTTPINYTPALYNNQKLNIQPGMEYGNINSFDNSDGPLISFEQKANPIERATGLIGTIATREQIKSEQKYRDSTSIIKDRKMRRYAASAMGNYIIPNQQNSPMFNPGYDDDDLPISVGRMMTNSASFDAQTTVNGRGNSFYNKPNPNFNDLNNYYPQNIPVASTPYPMNQTSNRFSQAPIRRSSSIFNTPGPMVVDNAAFLKNSNIGYAQTVSNYPQRGYYDIEDYQNYQNIQKRPSMVFNNQTQHSSFINVRNSQFNPNFQNNYFPQYDNQYNMNPMGNGRGGFENLNRNSASFTSFQNQPNQYFNNNNGFSLNQRSSFNDRPESTSTRSSGSISNHSSPIPSKIETSKFDPRSSVSLSKESAVINSGRFEKKTASNQSSPLNYNPRFSAYLENKEKPSKTRAMKHPSSNLANRNDSKTATDFDDVYSSPLKNSSKTRSKKISTPKDSPKNSPIKLEFEYDSTISQPAAITFEKFLQKCVDTKPYSWVVQHDAYSSYLNFCIRNGVPKNERVSLETFIKMMGYADWAIKTDRNGQQSFYNMVLV
ncbi:hypothetical protein AYI68_g3673 [Smittium mucronatum]|uniref:PH domain-containing protein n=1 Tax=Smittium mucronatum TaxID=133383 RepID=A0A1R0GZ95_9FUNG|nr:hypothetical protein AYI68_g3673 [Smittium mucronatum]